MLLILYTFSAFFGCNFRVRHQTGHIHLKYIHNERGHMTIITISKPYHFSRSLPNLVMESEEKKLYKPSDRERNIRKPKERKQNANNARHCQKCGQFVMLHNLTEPRIYIMCTIIFGFVQFRYHIYTQRLQASRMQPRAFGSLVLCCRRFARPMYSFIWLLLLLYGHKFHTLGLQFIFPLLNRFADNIAFLNSERDCERGI